MVKKTKATAAQRVEVEPIFGDFGELEHVCYLLHEQAKVADAPAGAPVHENGPIRLLRQRMRYQWDGQAREIEAEHPGLFDRTYLAGIYRETDAILERITLDPGALPGCLERLELMLHKLFILPLRDSEEVQRELQRAKVEHAAEALSAGGKKAADARHDKPGGARDKKRTAWELFLTGEYGPKKDPAAEKIAPIVGKSFSVTRRYLQGSAPADLETEA